MYRYWELLTDMSLAEMDALWNEGKASGAGTE